MSKLDDAFAFYINHYMSPDVERTLRELPSRTFTILGLPVLSDLQPSIVSALHADPEAKEAFFSGLELTVALAIAVGIAVGEGRFLAYAPTTKEIEDEIA